MAIILLLALLVALILGAYLCPPKHSFYFSTSVTAFLGAFFSYLFVRIAEAFEKIYKRQSNNLNTLVHFEHKLNFCLDDIGTNIFVMDSIKEHLSKDQDKPLISINRLRKITSDFEKTIELSNIDLVNDLVNLSMSIRKMNTDIENMNKVYEIMIPSPLNQQTYEEYKRNVPSFLSRVSQIRGHHVTLRENIKKIFALIRILSQDKPIFASFIIWYSRSHYNKKVLKELPDELKKLNSELESGKHPDDSSSTAPQ